MTQAHKMKKLLLYCYFSILFSFISCQENASSTSQSYLAIGDNYTIGESISESQSWPIQLIKLLSEKNINISSPRIIAKTGWTTNELKTEINNSTLDYPYDWVSLLIGVNNQSRGRSIQEFRKQFETLLSDAITFSGNKKKVFVISIPDWGVMPFAEDLDKEQIATEIDNFNQIIYEICAIKGINFIDITPISRIAKTRNDFIANDSLHPSGIQYTAWVQKIIPFFLNYKYD
tara:strand:+ start:1054 stop:1749 length:696 start_codon:yes stop_codon:yes gene_type:complete